MKPTAQCTQKYWCFLLRMASSFQLGDEQPSLKPTNLTKGAANSFNNLFGPPAPAKVFQERGQYLNPTPAKVAPVVSSALKSGIQQSKVAPAGLVGEASGVTKRSRKPLPINPLTRQVIGSQSSLRQEVRHQRETSWDVVGLLRHLTILLYNAVLLINDGELLFL